MSQFGSPSESNSAPEMVAAVLKIRFEPDQQSLDQMKELVERTLSETTEKWKVSMLAAIGEVSEAMVKLVELREQAMQLDAPAQRAAPSTAEREAPPLPDQLIERVTDISRDVIVIRDEVQEINSKMLHGNQT
mgnify:FL=1